VRLGAVENDLAAHPTVEYIRRLEDESARYRTMMQTEQRRAKQLQSALDAKERLLQAAQQTRCVCFGVCFALSVDADVRGESGRLGCDRSVHDP
jgi:hypothetical protein